MHKLPPLSSQFMADLDRANRERIDAERLAAERDALRQAGLLSGRRVTDTRNDRRIGLPDLRPDKIERRQAERRSDVGDRRTETRRQQERRQ